MVWGIREVAELLELNSNVDECSSLVALVRGLWMGNMGGEEWDCYS
jgi:hypothetical protein